MHQEPAPHFYLDDPETREKYYEMVREIVTKYYNGDLRDVDFTKWFHDLYRPNHRPYDPKEIDVIREFCTLANEDFAKKQQMK